MSGLILPELEPEVIYCHAQIFAGNRLEPREYCTNEVEDYGDLCPQHEEDDRSDELYDRYLDEKYEHENYPEDFGD